MTAMVDYQGFRIMASSVLPLHANSIKWGSTNAGKSFHHSDQKLNLSMQKLAQNLKLRGHYCRYIKDILIYGPIDAEGHLGIDKRYYLLDLARLFPPSSIPTNIHVIIIPHNIKHDLVYINIPRGKDYMAHAKSILIHLNTSSRSSNINNNNNNNINIHNNNNNNIINNNNNNNNNLNNNINNINNNNNNGFHSSSSSSSSSLEESGVDDDEYYLNNYGLNTPENIHNIIQSYLNSSYDLNYINLDGFLLCSFFFLILFYYFLI